MASFNRQLTKLRKSPPNQHNKNPSENPSTDLSAWFLITCGICANNQKEIDKYPLSSDRFARNFTVSPEKAPCLNISAACSISVCAHSPTHPLTNQLYQLYQLYQLLYQQSCVKNPQTTKPKAKKLRSRGSDNRALADNRFEFEGFFTLWLDYAAYIFTQRDIVRRLHLNAFEVHVHKCWPPTDEKPLGACVDSSPQYPHVPLAAKQVSCDLLHLNEVRILW